MRDNVAQSSCFYPLGLMLYNPNTAAAGIISIASLAPNNCSQAFLLLGEQANSCCRGIIFPCLLRVPHTVLHCHCTRPRPQLHLHFQRGRVSGSLRARRVPAGVGGGEGAGAVPRPQLHPAAGRAHILRGPASVRALQGTHQQSNGGRGRGGGKGGPRPCPSV
jgi:hypothetical protein